MWLSCGMTDKRRAEWRAAGSKSTVGEEREISPLLDLSTKTAREVTFPSVSSDSMQSLLREFNSVCTELLSGLSVSRVDVLRALSRLADGVEQSTAPVNGIQHNQLVAWLSETDPKQYPTGTRTAMARFQEFLLEKLEAGTEQSQLRQAVLHYTQAVEYDQPTPFQH